MSSSSGSDESLRIILAKKKDKKVKKRRDYYKKDKTPDRFSKYYRRIIQASHLEKAIFTTGNSDCYNEVAANSDGFKSAVVASRSLLEDSIAISTKDNCNEARAKYSHGNEVEGSAEMAQQDQECHHQIDGRRVCIASEEHDPSFNLAATNRNQYQALSIDDSSSLAVVLVPTTSPAEAISVVCHPITPVSQVESQLLAVSKGIVIVESISCGGRVTDESKKEHLSHGNVQACEATVLYYYKSVLQWICHHTTEMKVSNKKLRQDPHMMLRYDIPQRKRPRSWQAVGPSQWNSFTVIVLLSFYLLRYLKTTRAAPVVTTPCFQVDAASVRVVDYVIYSCTFAQCASGCEFRTSVDIFANMLVVGGGGGGGRNRFSSRNDCKDEGGGGGGGGGVGMGTLTLQGNTQYTVTVGQGGDPSANGAPSTIKRVSSVIETALGGQAGANGEQNTIFGNTASGGGGNGCRASGGREGGSFTTAGSGSFTYRGNRGGRGNNQKASGGGGGAGSAGFAGSTDATTGDGGSGLQWQFNGLVYGAGGGGGAGGTTCNSNARAGDGGSGIGGNGGPITVSGNTNLANSGRAAATNTGSGGGGASCSNSFSSGLVGGRGADGVVLIAFIQCKAGFGLVNAADSSCTACQAGFFSRYGDNVCQKCPAGSRTSSALDACLPCPAGTFSDVTTGSSSCKDCSIGKFANPGSISCTSCPANNFATRTGDASVCTLCPAGTQSVAGSLSCTSCPESFFSISGQSCKWCGAQSDPLLKVNNSIFHWAGGPT
eukprot:gene23676-30707_t